MDNAPEEYETCFLQDGVLLKKASSMFISFLNTVGTIYINKIRKGEGNEEEYILDWKPNEITIDSETHDQEWAVVNTVQERIRTLSENSVSSQAALKCMRFSFNDIKSFKVGNKNRQISFLDGSSETLCSFIFQHGNCDCLVAALKTYLKVNQSRRDKQLYIVYDSNSHEFQMLNKSFSALDLKTEDNSFWGMLKNFKDRPYEESMGAFAKVTKYMTQGAGETSPELTKDVISLSITELDDGTVHSGADYEVITAIPALPARKNYPRSDPLTEQQWLSEFNSDGQLGDVEKIKILIFQGGVHPSIRKEVWSYLLGYYPWDSTAKMRQELVNKKKDEYYVMKLQWKTLSKKQEDNFAEYSQRSSLVTKDVNRTDRNLEFYAGDDNVNLQTLRDILITYIMYNFDLGYVQGMSDLLSPILLLMQDECDSFWCFVGFMEKVMSNFDIDQAGMKEQLTNLRALLSFVNPTLGNYLDTHECGNMFFCFRWLLVWFKRELSPDDVMRFWEILWSGYPCQNFHLLVSVAILEHEQSSLMATDCGFTEILKYVNELSGKINIDLMINLAEGIFNQIIEAEHLTDRIRSILGLPPVGNNEIGIDGPHGLSNTTYAEPGFSINNVRITCDEAAYDQSINSNYL